MKNKTSVLLTSCAFFAILLISGILFALSKHRENQAKSVLAVVDLSNLPQNGVNGLEGSPVSLETVTWENYAIAPDKVVVKADKPKIALVLTNLGRDRESVTYILGSLPQAYSLAILPAVEDINKLAALIHEKGREILCVLPMEPMRYPDADPGPKTLLTHLSTKENLQRLHWMRTRVPPVIGFVNFMGSRFLSDKAQLTPILQRIKEDKLVFLEAQKSLRSRAQEVAQEYDLPYLRGHFYLEEKVLIDRQQNQVFSDIEAFAKQHGVAIVVVDGRTPYLQSLRKWVLKSERAGFQFVPISAVYRNPSMFRSTSASQPINDLSNVSDETDETDTAVENVLQEEAFKELRPHEVEMQVEEGLPAEKRAPGERSDLTLGDAGSTEGTIAEKKRLKVDVKGFAIGNSSESQEVGINLETATDGTRKQP